MPQKKKLPGRGGARAGAGRKRHNPPTSVTQAFVLWPAHAVAIDDIATEYSCSRSEALRRIIDAGIPQLTRMTQQRT
jgi:hypothetical protein